MAEVRTAEGKLHLFVAIDRTRTFAFVQLVEKASWSGWSTPCLNRIHSVLTDNAAFNDLALSLWG